MKPLVITLISVVAIAALVGGVWYVRHDNADVTLSPTSIVSPYLSGSPGPSSGDMGVLTGKVAIGPLCPVEPCRADSSGVYLSRRITLTLPGGTSPVIMITLAADGSFYATVPAGTYQMNLTNCTYLGCSRVVPRTVTIASGQTLRSDLTIDTGIR